MITRILPISNFEFELGVGIATFPCVGLFVASVDEFVFEFRGGAAIAPIVCCSGVGVVNGILRSPINGLCFVKSDTISTPLKSAIIIEKAAVAKTLVRCFTFAQPTGQSSVITLPSARL